MISTFCKKGRRRSLRKRKETYAKEECVHISSNAHGPIMVYGTCGTIIKYLFKVKVI